MKYKAAAFALAVIIFSTAQLQAQIMYGGKFGLNFSRLYGSDVQKNNQKAAIAPAFGGVLRTSGYNRLFAMQFEALYSIQGSKNKFSLPFVGSTKTVFRTHYVRVPVLASFSFGDRKVKAFFNVGPYVAFWVAAKNITKNDGKVKASYKFGSDDRRVDFGAEGGFGLSIETARGIIVPEFRTGIGFLSMSKDNSVRNLVLCLAASYLFGRKK